MKIPLAAEPGSAIQLRLTQIFKAGSKPCSIFVEDEGPEMDEPCVEFQSFVQFV